jgi:hypothetical protein
MNYRILLTDNFLKEFKPLIKKYKGLDNDLEIFQQSLAENPVQGDALGKDCYKIRMAITAKNKGKSGGARVIVCVKLIHKKVFLVSIFDKSERENIPSKRLTQMLRDAGLDRL